jgi:2-isopropylmalate synthase
VFNASRADIKGIAVQGTKWVKQYAAPLIAAGTRMRFEYSPESFTSTELDFALEICEAVTDVWQPTVADKIILNLPVTVEYSTPNVHADQIEWMCRHLTRRDRTIVSLHTHNDRGTGIAATELALLAGADRVEGTLFGNGERTGNLDIVTVALNLYTQGIHPQLDFGDINHIREVYERCTRLEVPARQPYAGELTFTAFSGSHQDAIKKSWAVQKPDAPWDVLYIPIDPADIGRSYKPIIRINSQSGKGGVAYVLEDEFGFQLPKLMHKEIGKIVNDVADAKGTELTRAEIHDVFQKEYLGRTAPVGLEHFKTTEKDSTVKCEVALTIDGKAHRLTGAGNGPIDAFVRALAGTGLPKFEVLSYSEHSLGKGAEARAVSYIQVKTDRGLTLFGAGIDTNIELASIKAIVSALNRSLAKR